MKRILFIAAGFPPYMFSENIVNGKLVLALQNAGYKVDVISRKDEGPAYHQSWEEPFACLKPITTEINYSAGNKLEKLFDTFFSTISMRYLITGVRWARRAYEKASELMNENNYDLIITRSPSDISHLVGLKLKKKKNTLWLANWNDPAASIWPVPYTKNTSYYIKLFEKEILKKADYLSFPSHTLKNHFIKSYKDIEIEKKHFIIPHIALSEMFINGVNSLNTDGVLRLCHAGNMSGERNPEKLFKAIKELIQNDQLNIQLDILGHVNPTIRDLIKKYDLGNVVRFLGGLPFLSALKKMKEYNVLVLLEAEMDFGIYFPSKLTDYVQLEIPVLAISPSVGYVKEIFSKYNSGIHVDNTKVVSIKNGIKKMYEIIILKKEGKSLISEDLIQLYSTQSVIAIYNSIINNK